MRRYTEAADRALSAEGEGFDEYYYTSRKEQPMHSNDGGGGGDGPNAFASLERMLEARLSAASPPLGESTGTHSRGASLRGAANYPGGNGGTGSPGGSQHGGTGFRFRHRHGSSSNVQRCGSNTTLSALGGSSGNNVVGTDG